MATPLLWTQSRPLFSHSAFSVSLVSRSVFNFLFKFVRLRNFFIIIGVVGLSKPFVLGGGLVASKPFVLGGGLVATPLCA